MTMVETTVDITVYVLYVAIFKVVYFTGSEVLDD